MNKKSLIKIIIPIFIVLIVFALWVIKNTQDNTSNNAEDNPDFALNVTDKLNLEKLKSYGLPIIIDFGADSCIPCKEMAPVLSELNVELKGKAIIKFVDVWKYQELAKDYPISVIPTQIIIDSNGNPFNPENPEKYQLKQYVYKDSGELAFTVHEGGLTKSDLLKILKDMGID